MSNQAGFSMIETMVAAGILAMGLHSSLTALGSVVSSAGHQSAMTQAILVGEATMEELFLPYKSGTDLNPGLHSRGFYKTGEPLSGGGSAFYTVEWTIVPDSPFPRTTRIDMTVRWQEDGVTRYANFTNYRS